MKTYTGRKLLRSLWAAHRKLNKCASLCYLEDKAGHAHRIETVSAFLADAIACIKTDVQDHKHRRDNHTRSLSNVSST
jgi:hypothetical protein